MESYDSNKEVDFTVSLNLLKFTLKAENETNKRLIINVLDKFIQKKGLIKMSRKPEDIIVQRTRYRLSKDFCDFLTIKITKDENCYSHITVTLNNIQNHFELKDLVEDAGGLAEHEYKKLYSQYCNKKTIINNRAHMAIKLMNLLQEEHLYKEAKIREIGFVQYLHLNDNIDPTNYSLLETHKNKKDGVFFHQYKLETDNTIFTKEPKFYKAFVKIPKFHEKDFYSTSYSSYDDQIEDSYLKRFLNKCEISSTNEEVQLLNKYFKKHYPHYETLEVSNDTTNRIFIKIDSSSIKKYGFPDEKYNLKFKPDFGRHMNHSSITYDKKEGSTFLNFNLQKVDVSFKPRIAFKLFVKNFVSRDKKFVDFYEGEKKINFRLGYEFEDIYSVISRFLKDFYIVVDSKSEFSDINKNLTIKKLFKTIDNSSIKKFALGQNIDILIKRLVGLTDEKEEK